MANPTRVALAVASAHATCLADGAVIESSFRLDAAMERSAALLDKRRGPVR